MGYRRVGYLEQMRYIVTWSMWNALRRFWKGARP